MARTEVKGSRSGSTVKIGPSRAPRELDSPWARSNVGAVIPRELNAAHWFVDRHVEEGRDRRLAIVYEGQRLTYGDVSSGANRLGNALRRLGVMMEQRVVLLLPDSPEFVWSFWGALKIGAVPVPTNTLLKPRDYEYILRDSRATVVIASESLVSAVADVRSRSPDLTHVVVVGRPTAGELAYADLVGAESAALAPAVTTKDDVAFWQYTSGTTGTPKAAVHLHHDMLVCCEAFGRHVLEIGPEDRTFSVAKLFFAYGLANALYFPFHVGASTVLYRGRPEPAKVFEVITRERPTLFYAVPTAYAAMLQVPDAERRSDRRHDQGGRHVGVAGGGGGRAGRASGCRGGGRRGCGGQGRAREAARVRRAGAGPLGEPDARGRAQGVREGARRRVQVPAVDRVRGRVAEDGNGEDPTIQIAGDREGNGPGRQELKEQRAQISFRPPRPHGRGDGGPPGSGCIQ